jgi:hypothetical protein
VIVNIAKNFNWMSYKEDWYVKLIKQAATLRATPYIDLPSWTALTMCPVFRNTKQIAVLPVSKYFTLALCRISTGRFQREDWYVRSSLQSRMQCCRDEPYMAICSSLRLFTQPEIRASSSISSHCQQVTSQQVNVNIVQAFNWESPKEDWVREYKQAPSLP